MKKKALSYLLCTAMVFSMAACGNESDGGADSQSDSSVEESSEESSEESTEESSEEAPSDDQETEGEDSGDDQQAEEPEVVAEGPVALRVEAESYEQGDGVTVEDDHLGGLNTKAWAGYTVDLADGGYGQIAIRYGADSPGGTLQIYLYSDLDDEYEEWGTKLCGEEGATFEGTGSWDADSDLVIDIPGLQSYSGSQGLVFEWISPDGDYLMNPDYFELYKTTDAKAKTNTWKFFNSEFAEGAGLRGEPTTHIYVNGGTTTGYKVNFGDTGNYTDLKMVGDFVGECELEVHIDAPDGPLVGSASFTGAAEWNDAIVQTNSRKFSMSDLAGVTGVRSVYFVFKSGDYNWANFSFAEAALTGNDDAKTLTGGYNTLTVLPDSVTVTEGFEGFGGEGPANLFDDDIYTKYCCGIGSEEAEATSEITFSVGEAAAITGYAVYTANDNDAYPERNPVSWVLSGKNESGEWVEIDASGRDDIAMEDVNYTAYGRFVEGAAAYAEYKFAITHNGTMQISELQLFGEAK